ncbi:MAG: tRNA pseudouridine(55) synthase TruB, partial [Pseudomonadota bacterium]
MLDKPAGLSSNRALQRLRNGWQARKCGHTGSLDPLATGMLPICFGDATRFSHFLLDASKAYRVEAQLGEQSSTGDAEGEIVATAAVPPLTKEDWQAVAANFTGVIQQVPPMYSALKVDGKRLYELARKGQIVARKARTIEIYALDVISVAADRLVVEVECSKGTYIRSLVEDLAVAAGTLAWTRKLHRRWVAPFRSAMHSLEDLLEHGPDVFLLPPDTALEDWPAMPLDSDSALSFCAGRP